MSHLDPIKEIWPDIANNLLHEEHYSRLIEHLENTASVASVNNAPYATGNLQTSLELIGRLRGIAQLGVHPSIGDFTRSELLTLLVNTPTQGWLSNAPDNITNSLCLGISLWLTLDVKPSSNTQSQSQTLLWPDNSTLSSVIESAFPQRQLPQPQGNQQVIQSSQPVDSRLTMESLCNYHGFRVLFTDNLAEHLQIQWQGVHSSKPLIMIYQHKIFLWNELRFPQRSPLPRELVEETLDTLNLLFPCNDYHTAKFLRSHRLQDFYGLGWCGRGRQRDLNHYHYWRDRISELSDIIKGAPLGFQQLKPDRNGRNLREFLNFWVAVFVGLFTVVSIAFGAASIALAKWQYDLAAKQYDLSLAQACAAPNATEELPGFCKST